MPEITPAYVLARDKPVDGYLCAQEDNVYGIEFIRFEIKDYDSGVSVYQVFYIYAGNARGHLVIFSS